MAEQPRRCVRVEYAEVAGAAPLEQPTTNGAALQFERKAVVYGGWCNGVSHAHSMEYDLATKQWSAGPSLPMARSESTVAVVGGVAVMFGGWSDKATLAHTLVAKVANLVESKPHAWEPLHVHHAGSDEAPLEPPPRRMHAMCSYHDGADGGHSAIYVFGGFSDDHRYNDLWKFDVKTMQWSLVQATGFIPSPRDSCSLAADPDNGRLLLFGGYSSCRVNELCIFDIESCTWARQPTQMPPSARFGCFGVVCNGHLVVGFGQDARGASAQIFQLKLADFKWGVVPLEGDELEPRIHFGWCASEGNKRIIVVGGSTDRKQTTTTFEIELDKVDAVPGGPGAAKKK